MPKPPPPTPQEIFCDYIGKLFSIGEKLDPDSIFTNQGNLKIEEFVEAAIGGFTQSVTKSPELLKNPCLAPLVPFLINRLDGWGTALTFAARRNNVPALQALALVPNINPFVRDKQDRLTALEITKELYPGSRKALQILERLEAKQKDEFQPSAKD